MKKKRIKIFLCESLTNWSEMKYKKPETKRMNEKLPIADRVKVGVVEGQGIGRDVIGGRRRRGVKGRTRSPACGTRLGRGGADGVQRPVRRQMLRVRMRPAVGNVTPMDAGGGGGGVGLVTLVIGRHFESRFAIQIGAGGEPVGRRSADGHRRGDGGGCPVTPRTGIALDAAELDAVGPSGALVTNTGARFQLVKHLADLLLYNNKKQL